MEVYLAGFFFNSKKAEVRPPFPLPILPDGKIYVFKFF
jgi:hypothetical protein